MVRFRREVTSKIESKKKVGAPKKNSNRSEIQSLPIQNMMQVLKIVSRDGKRRKIGASEEGSTAEQRLRNSG